MAGISLKHSHIGLLPGGIVPVFIELLFGHQVGLLDFSPLGERIFYESLSFTDVNVKAALSYQLFKEGAS